MGGLQPVRLPLGFLVVVLGLLPGLVLAGLVPFTISRSSAELEPRNLYQDPALLQPRYEVELHYGDEVGVDHHYLATAVVRHDHRPYVLVESFDSMLAEARDAWSKHDSLTLITHHRSCNEAFEDRAPYICSSFQFDDNTLTAEAACEETLFAPSTDASTSLSLKGGLAPAHTAKRLRRRAWGFEQPQFFRQTKGHIIELDDAWDMNEPLISIRRKISLTCRQCSYRGAVAVGFDIHIPKTAISDATSERATGLTRSNFLNIKTVRLEIVREVAADLNLQLDAIAALKFSWPGLLGSSSGSPDKPSLGKRVNVKKSKTIWEWGAYKVQVGYRYGLSVNLDLIAGIQAKLPVSAIMPAHQALVVDVQNPLASTSTFAPIIDVKKPTFVMYRPQACFSVGIGYGFEVVAEAKVYNLGRKTTKLSTSFQLGLDTPKIETCFKETEDVNVRCNAGNIKHGIEETTEAGWGVKFETWVKAQKPGLPAPQTPLFKSDLGQVLHPTQQLHHRCWDRQDLIGKPEARADSEAGFPPIDMRQPLPVNGGGRNRPMQDASETDPDTQIGPDGAAGAFGEADVAPDGSLVPRRGLQAGAPVLPQFPAGDLPSVGSGPSRQPHEGQHPVAKPGGAGQAYGHTNAPAAAAEVAETPGRPRPGRVAPPPPPPAPRAPALAGETRPKHPKPAPGQRPPRKIASPPPPSPPPRHEARVGVLD